MLFKNSPDFFLILWKRAQFLKNRTFSCHLGPFLNRNERKNMKNIPKNLASNIKINPPVVEKSLSKAVIS